jgi:hypothetical protein
MVSALDLERHLPLVPSVVFNGRRIRAVFDKLQIRPENETFHEFLLAVVQWTFGDTWWKHQLKLAPKQRHVVLRWYDVYCDVTRDRTISENLLADQKTYGSSGSGPIWAVLTLGFDLFCIQLKRHLPEYWVERLRGHASFQSARYEVAVAAILNRAGFELEYVDENPHEGKLCEFIAHHARLQLDIAVEAKKPSPSWSDEYSWKFRIHTRRAWPGAVDPKRAEAAARRNAVCHFCRRQSSAFTTTQRAREALGQ